jgi:hypothetical protein
MISHPIKRRTTIWILSGVICQAGSAAVVMGNYASSVAPNKSFQSVELISMNLKRFALGAWA